MIADVHPIFQAFLGTLVTWGLTALGSALVFVLDMEDTIRSQKLLDWMLGFAGGVMLAASYWSLLAPAIQIIEESDSFATNWAFIPVSVGFAAGAGSMIFTENTLEFVTSKTLTSQRPDKKFDDFEETHAHGKRGLQSSDPLTMYDICFSDPAELFGIPCNADGSRRVLLLVIAITLHNFPEGLAVGVGFGSIGQSASATFTKAVNLAIGIGLQNFPEGLAVSMPLRRTGMSAWKAFMWGQMSGLVEPIGGMIGAGAVLYVKPMLPYALSFAAGAMIFVVVDDLIPEANKSGNRKLATTGIIAGFIVMMSLDVAFG